MKMVTFKVTIAFPDCDDMRIGDIYTAIRDYNDAVAVEVKEIEYKDENQCGTI